MSRKWNPYEINELNKYKVPQSSWESFGEMPVEYITGHCDFHGLDIKVTKDTLIPRIESIDMIKLAEAKLKGKTNLSIADVGTGSGALAILLATRVTLYLLVMSDISEKALEIAKENAERLIPGVKPKIFVSDLMNSFGEEKFDLIMANLPYIPSFRVKGLPLSVVDYEPHIALDGGDEGLGLIRKFLPQAKEKLKPGGIIILEIDYAHVLEDFQDFGFESVEVIKDEFGQRRFVVLLGEGEADADEIN
jgi:release factor glutamine methyltransferase